MSKIANKNKELPEFFTGGKNSDKKTAPYNICVVGHVDHGKSTLVGALLFKTGSIPAHLLEEYKRKAAAIQKESFFLAWVMDQTEQERVRGVTIDTAHAELITPNNRYYTIVDAPGHKDFLKNAISGISQADVALLVADVQNTEYADAKLRNNLSTVEHLRLCRFGGIQSLIVALNKMDTIPKEKRSQVFAQRSKEIRELLRVNGFGSQDPNHIKIIPVAAKEFYNIAQREPDFMDYNGETLLEALDNIALPPSLEDYPLRFYVEDVNYGIPGEKAVPTGKIVCGSAAPGDEVKLTPGGPSIIKTIQMHHQSLARAPAGCNVGISLKIDKDKIIPKGTVISHLKDAPKLAKQIIAECTIIQHPTAVAVGSRLILHHHTTIRSVEIHKIEDVRNLSGELVQPGSAQMITPFHKARFTLIPDKPFAIDPDKIPAPSKPGEFLDMSKTSQITLRDCNMTVGFGTCKVVIPDDTELA